MPEQKNKQPSSPSLASVEGDLIGTLFGYHEKICKLLRSSSMDDDKLDLAAKRIGDLLENVNVEMKRTNEFNLTERLEAAYDDAKRLVKELSGSDGDEEHD